MHWSRDEGIPSESIHEGIEDLVPVLLYRGDVSANAAEDIRTGSAAECSGDLLFDFRHADIAFREVIGERNVKVVHKR